MAAAPALPAPPSVQEMAMQDAPAGAPAMPPEPDTNTGISPDARVPVPLYLTPCTTHCKGRTLTVLGAAGPKDERNFLCWKLCL